MPVHAPVAVPANAWTLLAQLADGESCTVSNHLPFGVLVNRTGSGEAAPVGVPLDQSGGTVPHDYLESRQTTVYDGPCDLYAWAAEATALSVATS